MSDRKPLMPKATAAWLVENSALTFDQIADFCQMHLLEVKGIADGDVATGIKGMDPISSGQLTREEILRAEKDPKVRLRIAEPKFEMPQVKSKRGPRYTPVSRRHDRPNAVLWLLRNHAELKDSQIMRLVGTTKPTILQVRDRSHWNAQNLQPQDPVTLGLCTQVDLDAEVRKSAKRLPKDQQSEGDEAGGTLLPASDTTGYVPGGAILQPKETSTDAEEATSVGALRKEEARMLESLKGLVGEKEEEAEAEQQPDLDDDDDDDGKRGNSKRKSR